MKKIKLNKDRIKNLLIFGQALLLIPFLLVKCGSVSIDSIKSNEICMNYTDTINTMEVKLIRDMIEKYTNNQLKVINGNGGARSLDLVNLPNHGDARAIWFDLETLKKFVYHIEKQSKKVDQSITSDKLGVRIYYAAYPEKNRWPNYVDLEGFDRENHTSTYGHKHTLVMIPTIKGDKGGDYDFNPLDKETFSGGINGVGIKDKAIKNALDLKYKNNDPSNTFKMMSISINNRTASQNHGSFIPPAENNVSAFINP